jgi:hypothetical protein
VSFESKRETEFNRPISLSSGYIVKSSPMSSNAKRVRSIVEPEGVGGEVKN